MRNYSWTCCYDTHVTAIPTQWLWGKERMTGGGARVPARVCNFCGGHGTWGHWGGGGQGLVRGWLLVRGSVVVRWLCTIMSMCHTPRTSATVSVTSRLIRDVAVVSLFQYSVVTSRPTTDL